MSIESFKDLLIWQRGIELTVSVYNLTLELPKDEKYGLSIQIKRASVSIPSNIAEGWSRNSQRSFLQFLSIARGSLAELVTQLILIKRTGQLTSSKVDKIEKEAEELSRMIQALRKKVKHKIKNNDDEN